MNKRITVSDDRAEEGTTEQGDKLGGGWILLDKPVRRPKWYEGASEAQRKLDCHCPGAGGGGQEGGVRMVFSKTREELGVAGIRGIRLKVGRRKMERFGDFYGLQKIL